MNRPENLSNPDSLTPEAAVDRLIELHEEAVEALRQALERFFSKGIPPTSKERARFRYPELRLVYGSGQAQPSLSRAYAKFESPGIYATTITQPRAFRNYLIEQLELLVADYPTTPLDPATALPVQIYMWANEAERAFVERMSGAIIILLIFLMAMNITAIVLRRRFERRW